MTVNVAEYTALKQAIEWLNKQDIDDEITVKGDSMLVINQMKGIYRIKSDTSKYFAPKIRELLQDKKVKFIWIPREENEEADCVADCVAKPRDMICKNCKICT